MGRKIDRKPTITLLAGREVVKPSAELAEIALISWSPSVIGWVTETWKETAIDEFSPTVRPLQTTLVPSKE